MKPSKLSLYAAGAAILLVLVIGLYQHFHKPDPAIKKDIARSEVAETQYHAQQKASARTDTAVAKIEGKRKVALNSANEIHAVADTFGHNAQTVRDSLDMWRGRDSLHVKENDSLRAVIRSDSLEKVLLVADRNRWHVSADSLEAINVSLRSDVKKVNGDCHLPPFVPCPSRKASFVAGVGFELFVANQVRHPPKLKNAVVFAH